MQDVLELKNRAIELCVAKIKDKRQEIEAYQLEGISEKELIQSMADLTALLDIFPMDREKILSKAGLLPSLLGDLSVFNMRLRELEDCKKYVLNETALIANNIKNNVYDIKD